MNTLNNKRKLVFVAHPDDEFIFAYNLITSQPDVEWTVVCATYTPESQRGKEFYKSCSIMNVHEAVLLGKNDDSYYGLDLRSSDVLINFDKFDEIYTHNVKGEYGHRHHIECHNFILSETSTQPLFVFAHNFGKPNIRLSSEEKMESKILEVYEREMYIICVFDLINEGFIKIRG